jgi:hypothetical protein
LILNIPTKIHSKASVLLSSASEIQKLWQSQQSACESSRWSPVHRRAALDVAQSRWLKLEVTEVTEVAEVTEATEATDLQNLPDPMV